MSKIPHFLDSRLTDGGEVPACSPLLPRTIFWYSFVVLEAEYKLHAKSRAGKIRIIGGGGGGGKITPWFKKPHKL
jgi:hypothetical protein